MKLIALLAVLFAANSYAFTGIIFTDNDPDSQNMNKFLNDTFCTICAAMQKEKGEEPIPSIQPVPIQTVEADQSAWKLVAVDSEENVGENGKAVNFFDDNINTIWHTQWYEAKPNHPHQITIDMGEELNLHGFVYKRRIKADGEFGNGTIIGYEFDTSVNGSNWEQLSKGSFDHEALINTKLFAQPKAARYFRLRSLSSWAEGRGTPTGIWASGAEIDVLVQP